MTIPAAPLTSPRDQIIDKAQRVVRGYARSKDDWNTASSLTRLLQQMRQEYEGRFLYELIQNAYDAHADGADGRISVLLDLKEGDHGVLYVANTGKPFGETNFKAICELAQSDKAPDESIGNKGIGFKSVLQVCDWPEIYSAGDARGDRFGGYCFTFTRPEQYDEVAGDNRSLADDLRRDVAPYFLPRPLDEQPQRVGEFARNGMATVVRLPLKSDAARLVAVERVRHLRDEEVPVQLFLERLSALEIATIGGDAERPEVTLKRDALTIDDPASDPERRFEHVDLGAQGTWFITSRRMTAEAMRTAIAASVEEGQIDESWSDWSSDTWVSVAVRLDGSEVLPRLYTWLPMEQEAEAPLHGHLHAPFSTMLARTAASEDVELNARLLDLAADAAVSAVLTFRENEDALSETALIDLLAWDAHHFKRVTASFQSALEDAVEPAELELVPIEPLPDGRCRGPLNNTYRWDGAELSLIDRARLARDAGAELVSQAIGGARLDRLESYCRSFFAVGFQADSGTRAEWVEAVARSLHERRSRPRTWDRYYSDLAAVLEDDPDALRGRRVLLGADGKLHAPPPDDDGEGQHPFVFFPPARERTDEDDEVEADIDLKPPAALRRALVLMSEELTWTRQEGRTRRTTPARKFLEQNKLVRRFKTVDLLEHVGRALQRDPRATLAAAALRFTYRLYAGTRRSSELKGLDLRVPTRVGWRAAREAAFSPGWHTPLADQLAELVGRGSPVSPGIAELGDSLLLSPDEIRVVGRDVNRWRTFLSEIGVRDGLWPQPVPHGGDTLDGNDVTPSRLARRFRLAEAAANRWVAEVEAVAGWSPNHPYTPYRTRTQVTVIPGQGDYEALDHGTRMLFAELAASGLGVWPDGAFEIEWYRPNHPREPDARRWPSPIASFLRDAPWVPVADPGHRREEAFVPAGDAWFYSESRREEAPNFSQRIPGRVRRPLGASGRSSDRARQVGLGDWDEPKDALRLLRHLADIVEDSALPETGVLGFRRAYVDAWTRAASRDRSEWGDELTDLPVVVTRGGDLMVVRGADLGVENPVYLLADERSLAGRILTASELPVLHVDADSAGQVADLLSAAFPGAVRSAEDLEIEVVTDDGRFVPDGTGTLLVRGHLSWLETLVALILETKRGPSALGPRRRREVVDRLLRVRLVRTRLLELRIGGVTVNLPERSRDVAQLDDDRHPTLVLQSETVERGPEMADAIALAHPLCELLGITAYEDSLKLALDRLLHQGCYMPADEDFARVLELAMDRFVEARAHIGSSAERLIRLLAPAVGCFAGPQSALELLEAGPSAHNDEDVRQLLIALAPEPEAEKLLTAGSASTSPAELRDRLGIEYGEFNAMLRALPEYEPVHNAEGHRASLAHYVQTHREALMDELRQRYLAAFRASQPLDAYVAARALEVSPDPAWLDIYDLPPEEALRARVADWMKEHGSERATDRLPSIEVVREDNATLIAQAAGEASRLVPAWARKNGAPLHEIWMQGEVVSEIGLRASSSGVLDFDALDRDDTLAWFAAAGLWPGGMPVSLSPEELGLSEADLASQEDVAETEKLERQRRRRIVVLDDIEMSAERDNYAAILKHVNDTLHGETLSPHRAAQLAEISNHPGRGGGDGSRGGGGGGRPEQLSQAQKSAVGLVGEVVAYAWLQKRYPEMCKPSSWVSTYREIIGEPPGDDSLGYDFAIPLSRGTIFFEVKATSGSDTRFELGESEVRKASECARRVADDYRAIFITNALNADARRIHLLRNPMDPANAPYYRFPGSGLVCTFRLA